MKKYLLSFLLLPFSALCNAQAVPASNSFDRFMWSVTVGSNQSVGFSRSGVPVLSPGVPLIDTDGGLPRVSTSGTLTNPSGKPVAISATGRISALQTAKAVGRVLSAFSGPLMLTYAMLDLGHELGVNLSKSTAGDVVYSKSGDGFMSRWGPGWEATGATKQSSCENLRLFIVAQGLASASSYVLDYGAQWYCGLAGIGEFPGINLGVTSSPFSSQEFLDLIAIKSGWPATSNISKVLADPAAGVGEKIQTEPMTVTGPSTSAGTVKTTIKTLPDGSTETTTETTDYKHNYSGPAVSTTVSTVTKIDTCTGAGACSTSSTSTTEQPSDPAPDGVVSDTAFSELPKLYTPTYATGLKGVWQIKSASLNSTPLGSLVGQLMPNIGTGGSCPVWLLNLDIGPWAYGSHDVAPPCYIWSFAKVFVIIGALLLARSLVFGG